MWSTDTRGKDEDEALGCLSEIGFILGDILLPELWPIAIFALFFGGVFILARLLVKWIAKSIQGRRGRQAPKLSPAAPVVRNRPNYLD